ATQMLFLHDALPIYAATGISGFTSSPNPPIGRLSFDDDDSVTRRVAFPYRYLHRLTFNSYGMKNKNYSWVYKNSLSLALVILFLDRKSTRLNSSHVK